jgi:hypothetical protein
MERRGLVLSFKEVFTHATIFFNGGPLRLRQGETAEDARRRKTWDLLESWEPRVVGPRRRLIVAEAQGESTKSVSELLGEAITLSVAYRVMGVPFRYWNKRTYGAGVRHDFDATTTRGKVHAEARGRYQANNQPNAVKGALDKFDELAKTFPRTYYRMLAVVYNLRTSPDDISLPVDYDVLVVDPEDIGGPGSKTDRWRALARHYAEFFEFQGMRQVSSALRELARASNQELLLRVRERASLAALPTRRGPSPWGRSTVNVAGREYRGTFWDQAAVPWVLASASPDARSQPVFWGLDSEVIRALAFSDLPALDEMSAVAWDGELDGYSYSHADSGSLFACSLSGRAMMDHP